jgi:transglutaminase-like putative cysteine protease
MNADLRWTASPAVPAHAPGEMATPLAAGEAALLEVSHETSYAYAAPVSLAHHLAHLHPVQDEHQQLQAFDLDIEPPPNQYADSTDAHGNLQRHFSLWVPHRQLRVRAISRLWVRPRFSTLQPQLSPPWDLLAPRLRYVAMAPCDAAVQWAMPSPFVPRLAALRDYAAPSFVPGRPIAQVALDLMQRIHADFRYESQSTDIDTPLAQVLATRRGVCQDFAHLMAGALRLWGVPARYVSGYLLTQPPEGGADMVGADASHAWVQVWCPGTPGVPAAGAQAGWLDLDPTNAVVPGAGHIRVAVGRDFGDVTPLRGVIRGGGRHTLAVAVHTRRLQSPGQSPERELLA